jgi:hypothetical protein
MVAIFSLLMIMKNGKSQKRAEDFTDNRKKKASDSEAFCGIVSYMTA